MTSECGILGPDEGASLPEYIKYQQSTGSTIKTFTFDVSKEDQGKIYDRAQQIGDPRGLSCATSVAEAIKGIGPFSSVKMSGMAGVMAPGSVADQMRAIQTAIAVEKVGLWIGRHTF